MSKGSKVIPVVLSGVQGNPTVLPALDRLILFSEAGSPIEPEELAMTPGPQGAPGPQGFTGTQGAPGPQGNQGFQGNQGSQGFQGTQGFQGNQGNQGFQGNQGTIGPAPPYSAVGSRPTGSDKDLFIQTDESVPPNATGTNAGLWQKEGGAYVRVAPRLKHGDNHAYNGIDRILLSDLLELFDMVRTSEVSVHPRILGTTVSFTSGNVYASPAFVRTGGTFTKLRFATSGAGAGVTLMRAGVWDITTKARLAQTADLSGSFVQNTVYDNVALDNSVTLTTGQLILLGIGTVATTAVNLKAATTSLSALSIMASGLRLSYLSAGLTGGGSLTDPIGSGSSANIPWVELIP